MSNKRGGIIEYLKLTNNYYAMKIKYNALKWSAFLLLTVFAFASCDKNDDIEIEKEAKIRIEIEHTGDFEHYGGGLSASSSLTRDLKMVTLTGVEWSDQATSNNVTSYAKDYENVPKVISFETTRAGTGLQFGYIAFVTSNEDEIVDPLKVSIKYFLDGKLVKTVPYDPIGDGEIPAPYLGKIEVGDY